MKWLLLGLLATFLSGCGSQGLQIIAENESGQSLKDVTVSSVGKSFKFGVLIDGGEKSYMSAEQMFGRRFPGKMTMSFATTKGELFNSNVEFLQDSTVTRKLRLKIGPDLKAIAQFE